MSNMVQKSLVLIVDPDPDLHRRLAPALEASSLRVVSALTLQEGLAAMVMRPPAAVVLGPTYQGQEGQGALHSAVGAYAGPIVVLARTDADDARAAAIAAGAYDVVVEPLVTEDLIARLKTAVSSREGASDVRRIASGSVSIDLRSRCVERDGASLKLTAREYDLLSLLAMSRGRVVTQKQLVDSLWPHPHCDAIQHLRVLIGHLRHKVEANASSPNIILTVPGVGYRFAIEGDEPVSAQAPGT